jgi:hypothetical protein
MNIIETSSNIVIPTVLSHEDISETIVGENDDITNNDSDGQFSFISCGSHIPFSMCNNSMKTNTTFQYLLAYF